MKYMLSHWAVVHSHIPKMSVIQNVHARHLANFPENYFKSNYLDTKRNMQDMYKNDRYLNDTNLPCVMTTYEVDDDPKETLEQIDWPHNYASHYLAGGQLSTYYWKIYENPVNHIQIYMIPVRKKITLNYKYLFPDLYSRDDIYEWMLTHFRYNGSPETYGVDSIILAPLPSNMLDYIATIEGYDLDKEDDMKTFRRELMSFSHNRFLYRKYDMEKNVGMMTLMYSHPQMQIVHDTRPEKGEGEQTGQVKSKYEITERFTFEPYFPIGFIVRMPEVVDGKQVPDNYKPARISNVGFDERILKTRNYRPNPVDKWLAYKPDKITVMSDIEFVSDSRGEEIIDIDDELYGPMHLRIIEVLKNTNKNPSDYYEIALFKYDWQMKLNHDYTVDWNHMQVRLWNNLPNTPYRIVCTAKREMLIPYIKNQLIHDPDGWTQVFGKDPSWYHKNSKYADGFNTPDASLTWNLME